MHNSYLNGLKRDRLFGKEITNIVDSKQRKEFRLSNYLKKNPLSQRGISEDLIKRNVSKVCKTSRNLLQNSLKIKFTTNSKIQKAQSHKISTIKNPQLIPQCFDQCFEFMLKMQKFDSSLSNYLSQSKYLNESMRNILLDWLLQHHYRFKMFPSTLFITVSIIDRYLKNNVINKSKLQLVGATALFMAAKYEQTYEVPELFQMIKLCAKVYPKQEFLEMEANILKQLNFDLIVDSSYNFLQCLISLEQVDKKTFSLSRYILQLSLFDTVFYKYKPSLLALSCIYLSNKLMKKSESWTQKRQLISNQQQVKICAKQLMNVLGKASTDPNLKSIKKKFSSASFHQVSKLRFVKKNTQTQQ